jgi:hypothetical protein
MSMPIGLRLQKINKHFFEGTNGRYAYIYERYHSYNIGDTLC